MSSTPAGSRLRIGDAERDSAATALGEHFASGRLTREEFDERLERAWAAKTADDLGPLFVDLPGSRTYAAAPGLPSPFPSPSAPVGFRARGGPPAFRGRRVPPVFFFVLAVLLAVTVLTHLPIVLMVLGILWVTGGLRRCGGSRSRSWAPSR